MRRLEGAGGRIDSLWRDLHSSGGSRERRSVVDRLCVEDDPIVDDLLVKLLDSDDIQVVYGAALGLGARGDRRAVPALSWIAADDAAKRSERRQAVVLLARTGGPRACETLLALVRSRRLGREAKESIVGELVAHPEPPELELLEALASDSGLREEALALAQSCLQALRPARP